MRAIPIMTRESVYNGHLQGPVTLTSYTERLAVELSRPVFYDLGLSRLGFEQTNTQTIEFPLLPISRKV